MVLIVFQHYTGY